MQQEWEFTEEDFDYMLSAHCTLEICLLLCEEQFLSISRNKQKKLCHSAASCPHLFFYFPKLLLKYTITSTVLLSYDSNKQMYQSSTSEGKKNRMYFDFCYVYRLFLWLLLPSLHLYDFSFTLLPPAG